MLLVKLPASSTSEKAFSKDSLQHSTFIHSVYTIIHSIYTCETLSNANPQHTTAHHGAQHSTDSLAS
jgi:hypothetical protein